MVDNVLIVKLSSLGDVIHTLPAAQALRTRFPQARLGWAVESAHAAVLAGQPFLDEVIVWQRGRRGGLASFVRRLRRTRWQLAVDFQGLFRSGLASWASGAKQRVGFGRRREFAHWWYTERVPMLPAEAHAVERSLELARWLGAEFAAPPPQRAYVQAGCAAGTRQSSGGVPTPFAPARWFPLYPGPTHRAEAEGWLRQHGLARLSQPLVLLHPHCRKPANVWPAARFAALARTLMARGCKVVLIGGLAAQEACGAVAAAAPGVLRADGRLSLLGSAVLMGSSAVVVTGDTGPMHIAAAVGTPIVALFGAASPLRTGPYTDRAEVITATLPCQPCFGRYCRLGYVQPACMELITVPKVLAAVERALARSAVQIPA
jgi:lipopolysaccharide heptosyltransferase I